MAQDSSVVYRYRFVSDAKKKPNALGYDLRAKVWVYSGSGAWYFVTIPAGISKEIKNRFGLSARGWGSLPVEVTVGQTRWITSVFPYKKAGGYILPIKADVRKKEGIKGGATIGLRLRVCVSTTPGLAGPLNPLAKSRVRDRI
jgi:hypothetical protein